MNKETLINEFFIEMLKLPNNSYVDIKGRIFVLSENELIKLAQVAANHFTGLEAENECLKKQVEILDKGLEFYEQGSPGSFSMSVFNEEKDDWEDVVCEPGFLPKGTTAKQAREAARGVK